MRVLRRRQRRSGAVIALGAALLGMGPAASAQQRTRVAPNPPQQGAPPPEQPPPEQPPPEPAPLPSGPPAAPPPASSPAPAAPVAPPVPPPSSPSPLPVPGAEPEPGAGPLVIPIQGAPGSPAPAVPAPAAPAPPIAAPPAPPLPAPPAPEPTVAAPEPAPALGELPPPLPLAPGDLSAGPAGTGASAPEPPNPGGPLDGFEGQQIVAVDVYENTRTDADTVIALAGLEAGDTFTAKAMEQARTNLETAGLFKDIDIFPLADARGGVRLVYKVHDKWSWVIAPTFSYSPGNLGFGVLYGENNLFGRNKKLLVFGNLSTADSHLLVGYLDPNLFGTPWLYWRVDGGLLSDVVPEYNPAFLHDRNPAVVRTTRLSSAGAGMRLGIDWFRVVKTDAWLRAQHLWMGNTSAPDPALAMTLGDADMDGTLDRPEGPFQQADEITLRFAAAYDHHANIQGVMLGPVYEVAYERSLPSLSSQFRFDEYTVSAQYGIRFFEQHNLVLRFWGGLGHDLPFHEEFVAGGASDLRGYFYRQLRGDHKAALSADYIFPLFHLSSLYFRGVFFGDSAAVWFGSPTASSSQGPCGGGYFCQRSDGTYRSYLTDQTSGFNVTRNMGDDAGIGLRLYLRSIVLPLLGVDYARGIENRSWQLVLSIGVSN